MGVIIVTARQEFQTILSMMSEEDVVYALSLIKDNFALRRREANWEDIEEIDSDEDDFVLMQKIQSQTEGYGEYVTQDDLLKRLDIKI